MKRLAILVLVVAALGAALFSSGASAALPPLTLARAAVTHEPGICMEQRHLISLLGYGPAKRGYAEEFPAHHRYWEQVFAGIYLVCNR